MVNPLWSLVIKAIFGISSSQASLESKLEAAWKKDAARKRAQRALWTDTDRKRDSNHRRALRKMWTDADRKRDSNRRRALRKMWTDADRKKEANCKKARRALWTDADRANEAAQKRRWRAEQHAKKLHSEMSSCSQKKIQVPVKEMWRSRLRAQTTSPALNRVCLADSWTSCPPEDNCQLCKTKFKPLEKNQISTNVSKIHGKGLFLRTAKAIEANTVIALVTGKWKKKDPKNANRYTIQVRNAYLEPHKPVRFVNHCCEPNSRFEKWGYGDDKKEKLALVSETCLEPNQEITVNYNDFRRFIGTCNCAACRQNE